MIEPLKALGYRFTEKDTLNWKEFRLSSEGLEIDEVLSTLETPAYNHTQIYELFLPTMGYSISKVKEILDISRDENEVVTGSADIEKQERGYLITLTFTIGD